MTLGKEQKNKPGMVETWPGQPPKKLAEHVLIYSYLATDGTGTDQWQMNYLMFENQDQQLSKNQQARKHRTCKKQNKTSKPVKQQCLEFTQLETEGAIVMALALGFRLQTYGSQQYKVKTQTTNKQR